MTLPDGFDWAKAHQYDHGTTALTLGDVELARMMEKVGGEWFVLVERQKMPPPGETFAPLVKRDCRSFEQGRRGTEIWASRHEARIREEVAARIAARPRHLAVQRN